MVSGCDEKLTITDKDSLRRRHAGNYLALTNGEIYGLPYEIELRSRHPSFFEGLSDFDFLKHPSPMGNLSFKALRSELTRLDDNIRGKGFWKNFNDSALKSYLNVILGTEKDKDWRKTYLKQAGEKDEDKPHHNDMLRCIYLLAHMHRASPSYIRELALTDCAWSTELRVYYPRTDFAFSEEYGAYLAELYTNILYYQPEGIRKLLKYLDKIIEKLVGLSDFHFVDRVLNGRSADTDSPGLKILKYNQIASISHYQALNQLLSEKITGSFATSSFAELEESEKSILVTARHCNLVAAQCVRMEIGGPSKKRGDLWYPVSANRIHQETIDGTIEVYSNALAADILNGLKFESESSKSGQKDTSISSAIKKMAEQNPQAVDKILTAKSLNYSNIPELYLKYMTLRTRYAAAVECGEEQDMLAELSPNRKVERVLEYVKGNNLDKINADIEELEMQLACMRAINRLGLQDCKIDNSTLIYEYDLHDLPGRR